MVLLDSESEPPWTPGIKLSPNDNQLRIEGANEARLKHQLYIRAQDTDYMRLIASYPIFVSLPAALEIRNSGGETIATVTITRTNVIQ